jgi:gamma-glutamylcyclotransferase (GGCT)/AIG2-like uncharacterized protein YtfP
MALKYWAVAVEPARRTWNISFIITANLCNTGKIGQMNIFTYGSLMFERVWTVVVAGTYRKTNARLLGYQRRKIRGEAYPALVPGAADDQVDGVVYLDVGQRDAVRLDRFEGAFYSKKKRAACFRAAAEFRPGSTFSKKNMPTLWKPELGTPSGLKNTDFTPSWRPIRDIDGSTTPRASRSPEFGVE